MKTLDTLTNDELTQELARRLRQPVAKPPGCGLTLQKGSLQVEAGTTYQADGRTFETKQSTEVSLPNLKRGGDYGVYIADGGRLQIRLDDALQPDNRYKVGGFHVDLGREILASSIWDLSFRPKCDPRGMRVRQRKDGSLTWEDIYLMDRYGQSRPYSQIADGYLCLPFGHENLNLSTAEKIAAAVGKQLMTIEDFADATDGVEEGKTAGDKQFVTGRIAGLTSKTGLEQATGVLWIWTASKHSDGDPQIAGGLWVSAGLAGPRLVVFDHPGSSLGAVGARFRCDHLLPV